MIRGRSALLSILLDPNTPNELLQTIWDDLFDHEDLGLLERNARQLAQIESHPFQEDVIERLEEFQIGPIPADSTVPSGKPVFR